MNQVLNFHDVQSGVNAIEQSIQDLLSQMTLPEKIGQMIQVDAGGDAISDNLRAKIRAGEIGSVLNQTTLALNAALQKIAREESRLGIPLLIARDVIHGFNTVFPIPLGQAATWNPELIHDAARIAAIEASATGINWTFAPMLDISRDPRWGRIAESFGEDPFLTSVLGVAMTDGFQGDNLSASDSIAACAKHFVGYGASEGGRDYSATNIPENELRNTYLPPFQAAVDAGIATVMSSFSDIDGIPAVANRFLLKDILREEWHFDGLLVSDWDAVRELSVHGLTADDKGSALEAASAGVDMEMAGGAYGDHLAELVEQGKVLPEDLDRMVANILRLKIRLGLFEEPKNNTHISTPKKDKHRSLAKEVATQSVVLLKNQNKALPLKPDHLSSIALIGPLGDTPAEQLGTWVFDGDPSLSVTPLQAIQSHVGDSVSVIHAPGLKSTVDHNTDLFNQAVAAANQSDVAIIVIGEDAILSGEAHSRANIDLPGAQAALVQKIKATGTPVITIIMAGRPLTLGNIIDHVDALLFAWHPGTMAGPALSDLLFGLSAPSGKLPVSFPSVVGQVPIYYNHKNTGRPPSPNTIVHIDNIQVGAAQTSLGMTSFHLDAGYKPKFPFGFGLSYTEFEYSDLTLSTDTISENDTLLAKVRITNKGETGAFETTQLYIRDRVGSVTRPVKELKGFQKVWLDAGQTKELTFKITSRDLAFSRRDKTFGTEPGVFHIWLGGSSESGLHSKFTLARH